MLTLVLAAGVLWAGHSYFSFVSRTIYTESTAHLVETFHQANQTLHNLVSINWSRMRMWEPYLGTAEREEDIRAYVDDRIPVSHWGRSGGILMKPEEVLAAVRTMLI